MKTTHAMILFMIICLAQIIVPAQMIYHQVELRKTGNSYKLKTQPIDPTDPFRGKYITLRYEIEEYKTPGRNWKRDEKVYVYLQQDIDGFAFVEAVSKHKLNLKSDFVQATVRNNSIDIVYLKFQFNRFYMEETKAKDAEIAYRETSIDSKQTNNNATYGLIYLKNGDAVLDNVYINDIPIAQYVTKAENLK